MSKKLAFSILAILVAITLLLAACDPKVQPKAQHTVKIEGEGLETADRTCDEGSKFTIPIKTRDGYTIDKITDGENEYTVGQEITVSRDLTLTYIWKPVQHTITLDWGDGSTETSYAAHGSEYAIPEKSRPGYILDNILVDGTEHAAGEKIPVASDLTIVYKWTAAGSHTVKVLKSEEDSDPKTTTIQHEGLFYVEPLTKDGLKISSVKGDDGVEYKDQLGKMIHITHDLTLTYYWEPVTGEKHTVTLKYGDGSPDDIRNDIEDGTSFTIPSRSRDGYRLARIVLSMEGAEDNRQARDVFVVNCDATLTYIWEEIAKCSVTLRSEGSADEVFTLEKGSVYKIPSKSRTGHTLARIICNGVAYQPNDPIEVDSDMVLVYEWTPLEHTVAVLSEEGAAPQTQKVAHEEGFIVPLLTKEGFVIKHIIGSDGNDYIGKLRKTIYITSDLTLTYQWEAKSAELKHTITLVVGGEGENPTQEVEDGGTYIVPEKTLDNHTLLYVTDGTSRYQPGAEISNITGDLTLTYEWELVKHKVVLKGEGVEDKQVFIEHGEYYRPPEWPKDGYASGDITYGENQTCEFSYGSYHSIQVNADMELTYHWKQLHTITLQYEGDPSFVQTETVVDGDSFRIPFQEREGFQLLKIKVDDTETGYTCGDWIPETEIQKDLVLVYVWEDLYCHVTVYKDGEPVDEHSANVKYNETFHLPILTKEDEDGKTFTLASVMGDDGVDYTDKVGTDITITKDLYLDYSFVESGTAKHTVTVVMQVEGEDTKTTEHQVYHGELFTIPSAEQHTVLENFTSNDGADHSPGDKIPIVEDITFTYDCRKAAQYTVTLRNELDYGDYAVIDTAIAYEGEPFVVPAPARDGYSINDVCIYDENEGWISYCEPYDTISVDRNLLITYRWLSDIVTVRLFINGDFDKPDKTYEVPRDGTYTPEEPDPREGFKFVNITSYSSGGTVYPIGVPIHVDNGWSDYFNLYYNWEADSKEAGMIADVIQMKQIDILQPIADAPLRSLLSESEQAAFLENLRTILRPPEGQQATITRLEFVGDEFFLEVQGSIAVSMSQNTFGDWTLDETLHETQDTPDGPMALTIERRDNTYHDETGSLFCKIYQKIVIDEIDGASMENERTSCLRCDGVKDGGTVLEAGRRTDVAGSKYANSTTIALDNSGIWSVSRKNTFDDEITYASKEWFRDAPGDFPVGLETILDIPEVRITHRDVELDEIVNKDAKSDVFFEAWPSGDELKQVQWRLYVEDEAESLRSLLNADGSKWEPAEDQSDTWYLIESQKQAVLDLYEVEDSHSELWINISIPHETPNELCLEKLNATMALIE